MSYIFIEIYNAKPSWTEKSLEEQNEYIDGVLGHVDGAQAAGVEILALGRNEAQTPHRSGYEFFCVYRVPSRTVMDKFAAQIENAGWYEYFEQGNLAGADVEMGEFFRGHAAG